MKHYEDYNNIIKSDVVLMQSEYVADCDQRRSFITGFTGSAGLYNSTINKDLGFHLEVSYLVFLIPQL